MMGIFTRRVRKFDVTDGVVRPNSARQRSLYERGQSKLIGLTRDQLIRSLSQKFPKNR
jgi:hypothetical protein